jgi:hypothetical protein
MSEEARFLESVHDHCYCSEFLKRYSMDGVWKVREINDNTIG